jgi:hypothetical protein
MLELEELSAKVGDGGFGLEGHFGVICGKGVDE